MKLEQFSGKKLKARREKEGFTVNKVLAKLWTMGHDKASAQLLRNYESDVNVPGMEYALSLATILKCTVHDFTENGKGK